MSDQSPTMPVVMRGDYSLVSLIIPAYNAGRYLNETISSVLAQTYHAIEVIIIDDGSTDDTATVLAQYKNKPRVRVIRQENKGVAAARNTALRVAKGEFIALLDADDIFLPNKIERQVAYLKSHPACDVCYCNILHFYDGEPEKTFQLQQNYYSGVEVLPHLVRSFFINPLSVVMRRSAVDRIGFFDERYRGPEDFDFFLRLAYAGAGFDHLPEVLAKYRMRRDSLSYNPRAEIYRKKMGLQIVKELTARMTPAEQKKYDTAGAIHAWHMRVWYAEAEGFLPPLRWFRQWRQRRRLI